MRFEWLVFAMLTLLFLVWMAPPARSEVRFIAIAIGAMLLAFMFLSLTRVVAL